MIITIDRKYGSGGRMVGEKLAKLLGYRFYDRELLKIAARESGMHEDVVSHFDERPAGSLLYSTFLYATMPVTDALPLNQKLAFAQFDVIRRVAQDFNVFVTASTDVRRERLVKYYGIPSELTDKTIKKEDKMRSEYYNFFTQRKWGDASNYHMTVDTGRFTLDGAAALLADAVHRLEAL